MATRLKSGSSVSYRPYLLGSADGGKTWTAAPLAVPDGRATWRATLEHNDANSDRGGPPPVLLFDQGEGQGARVPQLLLATSRWEGSSLMAGAPLRIADKSILVDNHSGGANSLVSTKDRIYVVYPASRTGADGTGTPAYLVAYNKSRGAVESETLLGEGGAAREVDNHNIPGVCIGRDQTVHVVLPGHQEDLRMVSGKLGPDGKPTFAAAQRIGEAASRAGGYTYASLNCDAAGNVTLTSRWSGDRYHFQLVALQRSPQGEWRSWNGRKHLVLVDPGRPFYGAWNQKATQDSDGNFYLYYGYYANHLSPVELASAQERFPFEAWDVAKEVAPPQCVPGSDRRCWMHPMPTLTQVLLKASPSLQSWQFVK
jgi:hypothetical protein